jgi:thiamine-phosphate pyrophosphorylase
MPPEPSATWQRPTLCLVTDRRRLAAAVGLPAEAWHDALLAQICGALAGGIDVVQLRERDLDDGALVSLARDCLRAVNECRGRIVINDRIDIAIACGAGGVHLREDGLPVAAARRLAPDYFLVGRSVHSAAAAADSAGADYVLAGPVFETVSKAGHPGLGLEGFRTVAANAPCPVWAIGGITPLHVSALVGAGASGVAAIGAFIPEGAGGAVALRAQALVERFRSAPVDR